MNSGFSDIDVTIVIASYNGEKTLPVMLDALCKINYSNEKFEIIAIDNNSNDQTRSIFESYTGKLPIKVHCERRNGKSFAMNLGLQQAQGELVILCDDDIILDPDCIQRYVEVAQRETQYDVISGITYLDWPQKPENWILEWVPMGITFAQSDEFKTGPVDAKRIYGPHFAIRRDVIARGCRFDESIGPTDAPVYTMGEDVKFAVLAAGETGMAFRSRDIRVGHIVREFQMSEEWILKRAERYGMGAPIFRPREIPNRLRIMGIPYSLLVRQFFRTVSFPILRFMPGSEWRFRKLWRYYYYKGLIKAL